VLEEEIAVKILAARDHAIKDVQGAMLNVFCDVHTVTSVLARMGNPPSLAIKAGPQHIVLSGSKGAIVAAETLFKELSIKAHALMNATPFHSTVMNEPARTFANVGFTPRHTDITFVSGLAGTKLSGDRLGLKYWQRHMLGSIDFHKAMKYVREEFPGAHLIDIGPNTSLTNILIRYGWNNMVIVSAEDQEAMDPLGSIQPVDKPSAPQPPSHHSPESADFDSLGTKALDTGASQDKDRVSVAKGLLQELFGYSEDNTDQLLSLSMQSLGIQSLDFLIFAEEFKSRTGLTLALSTYVTDDSLNDILNSASLD
jgi:hypothetical protein